MINRVLIRLKVVQMLYSYLLTQSDFRIQQFPEEATQSQQFVRRLYLDLLMLIPALCGYNVGGREDMPSLDAPRFLRQGRLAKALLVNSELRSYMPGQIAAFESVLPALLSSITASSAYRSASRKKEFDIMAEVDFWALVLRDIIAKSPVFEQAVRSLEGFSLVGIQQAVDLAVETLQSYGTNKRLLSVAKCNLAQSLDRAYDLYNSLLWLSVEITRAFDRRIDDANNRPFADDSDLNMNPKMAENIFVKALEANPEMQKWAEDHPLDWETDPLLVHNLLNNILKSDIYKEYVQNSGQNMNEDAEFWRRVYRDIIFPGDEVSDALEVTSVYWNDDLHIMGTFVLKTVKQYQTSDDPAEVHLLPKFKDEDDERFGAELFTAAVDNRRAYRSYIDRFIDEGQWDPERIAFMDTIIMITAIAEMLNFPTIPVPVTVNEYVNIAADYSTPQSGKFVNGMLRSIVTYLRNEGILTKP